MSQAACPSQHATPVAIVPRVQVAPASVEYARKMLVCAGVVRGGYEVVCVGRVDVDETLSLVAGRGADVDHRLQAGQRHEQQIGRFRCTLFGLYAFAGTVGHIDAAGRRQHLRVQDGCGRREERENGGKHSQVEACVHMCVLIDAASKSGLKRDSQATRFFKDFRTNVEPYFECEDSQSLAAR